MKPLGLFTLVGRIAVPCLDLLNWGQWMEKNHQNRHVGDDLLETSVEGEKISIRVSTVFIGLDHNFGEGDPLLFETMIFGGPHSGDTYRYHTWGEAEEGHRKWLDRERRWVCPADGNPVEGESR